MGIENPSVNENPNKHPNEKLISKKNKNKRPGSFQNKGYGEGNVKGHPEWG